MFAPVAFVLERLPGVGPPLLFLCAALAIIPVASYIGRSTEHLSTYTGDAVGGLRFHTQTFNPTAAIPQQQSLNLGFAVLLVVLIGVIVAASGTSSWFKGVQLIAVYLMIALMLYFVPHAG